MFYAKEIWSILWKSTTESFLHFGWMHTDQSQLFGQRRRWKGTLPKDSHHVQFVELLRNGERKIRRSTSLSKRRVRRRCSIDYSFKIKCIACKQPLYTLNKGHFNPPTLDMIPSHLSFEQNCCGPVKYLSQLYKLVWPRMCLYRKVAVFL